MDSANSPSFGRILSETLFSVIAGGIQNIKEGHRKLADHSRENHNNVANSSTKMILACCGLSLQCTERTVWQTKCGFRSQFAGYFNLAIHLFYSANSIVDSANLRSFGAILTATLFLVFVCGIQNSKEDHRKTLRSSKKIIAMLRSPRQIWLWPVAVSAYNSLNAQFGRVMLAFCVCEVFNLRKYCNCLGHSWRDANFQKNRSALQTERFFNSILDNTFGKN